MQVGNGIVGWPTAHNHVTLACISFTPKIGCHSLPKIKEAGVVGCFSFLSLRPISEIYNWALWISHLDQIHGISILLIQDMGFLSFSSKTSE